MQIRECVRIASAARRAFDLAVARGSEELAATLLVARELVVSKKAE